MKYLLITITLVSFSALAQPSKTKMSVLNTTLTPEQTHIRKQKMKAQVVEIVASVLKILH